MNKSRKVLIIIASVIAVLLIAFGAVFYYYKSVPSAQKVCDHALEVFKKEVKNVGATMTDTEANTVMVKCLETEKRNDTQEKTNVRRKARECIIKSNSYNELKACEEAAGRQN